MKIVVFLSFIFFVQTCAGIPGLKIVMSPVHKSVTFGVILNKSLIFCSHECYTQSRAPGCMTSCAASDGGG